MSNLQTIQRVSPAYVVRALTPQPYGTYIIRYQTQNDEIISSIHMKSQSITPSQRHRYVVLSVRVDETVYKFPIMHYRLLFTGENHGELLKQYNFQQNKSENMSSLKRELILSTDDQSWILNPKEFHGIDIHKGHFCGKNNTGISEAIWKRSGQDDIKIFIKSFAKTSVYFENELNILKQLCFFPIITLYGQYSDNQNNYLVFSHGGKSLESKCPLKGRTIESKMSRIINIGFQISNAMIYLEKKNIVHRDLTASNVLIDDYGYIRIADFGHAIQKVEGQNNLSTSVTKNGQDKFQIRFLAPECIRKPLEFQTKEPTQHQRTEFYASFSSKSDVWAFGILLIQLMLKTPSKPYPHIEKDVEVSRRVVINREMHPKPDECNIDIYYILQQCWAYEPINRISFTEIREKMNRLASIFH